MIIANAAGGTAGLMVAAAKSHVRVFGVSNQPFGVAFQMGAAGTRSALLRQRKQTVGFTRHWDNETAPHHVPWPFKAAEVEPPEPPSNASEWLIRARRRHRR